ncbi:hypothetical protein F7Q99_30885 [Streptomyces kaniharaensis]|uniref:Nuclear transport factor 2 family protein n=1 Tax=Streptomyces kaniharaensis TaxID=212423 RepID=A0A6N7L3Q1_9ACTN|nr:hypothetical protein [Streptomyces kaniharaensis]MQS16483.1 hypothetical protein [Streptomyces kaniharaensis]
MTRNQTAVVRRGPSGGLHRSTAVVLGVGMALAMSACSSKADKVAAAPSVQVPSPTSATATPSTVPTAKATADVLAVYQAYTDAKVAAMTTGHADPDKLLLVATGDAYDNLAGDITRAQQAGIVYKGTEVTHPQVTALNLSDSPQKATLTDCIDVSNWTAVFSSTGANAAATGMPGHLFVNVEAVQNTGSTWRISAYTPDRSRTC